MAFADKKLWDKTRPSDIKKTGIGDACDLWKKNAKPPKDIADDKAKTSAALQAIDAMLRALDNAAGQLNKVKDAKKKKAVQDLLDEWKGETEEYQKELNARVIQSVEAEVKDKIEKATKGFEAIFQVTKDKLDDELPRWCDDAEKWLKSNEVQKAEAKLNDTRFQLKQCLKVIDSPEEPIAVEEKRVGLTPGTLKPRVFQSMFNEYKGKAKKLVARLDKLGEMLDEAGPPTVPEPSSNDPEYKKKFAGVKKLYEEMLDGLDAYPKKAKEWLTKATQLNGNPLIQSNPDGVVRVATKILEEIKKLAEESAKELSAIRDSSGKAVKARNAAGLTKEDVLSFGAYTTRGLTLNGRVITTNAKTIEQLRECMDLVIQGGNEEAVKEAKKLRAKLK